MDMPQENWITTELQVSQTRKFDNWKNWFVLLYDDQQCKEKTDRTFNACLWYFYISKEYNKSTLEQVQKQEITCAAESMRII